MSRETRQKLLFVFGTRPETVKLSPVIRAARERHDRFDVRICVTGQHRQMLDTFLSLFDIRPDVDLKIMEPGQTLSGVASRVLDRLDPVLEEMRPDWVIVQGDTTTTLSAAMAAFHRRIAVAHVEAGLRTWDLDAPYPEEMNRQLTSRLTSLHLAPTDGAAANLRREGVPDSRILVTGNTVIDALLHARAHLLADVDLEGTCPALRGGRRLVLVTGHRRESFGKGLENLCLAIRELLERHEDVAVVYPVHMNPNVREPVSRILAPAESTGRLQLLAPVDYPTFVALLDRCHLVLTDSGGVQEEAPSLGKPVLCTREVTERPEGVEAGAARLVGTDPRRIGSALDSLLNDQSAYRTMAEVRNPYGDGRAASRILDALLPDR